MELANAIEVRVNELEDSDLSYSAIFDRVVSDLQIDLTEDVIESLERDPFALIGYIRAEAEPIEEWVY